MKMMECVPNFSEGRRREVIDAIVNEALRENVYFLDLESDPDHNRSVLTFAGEPEEVKKAALRVAAKAIELIDLNVHKGQHPRMGALDVVPFVPLQDCSMEEAVATARDFGRELAERFQVPVYLYEEAASRPERRDLANVRKGEFEGLRSEIGKVPDRDPDFGPLTVHPTAGATAVGARQILIAYNVNLGTSDVQTAKKIAQELRGRNGGLSAVKALGFELKERGIVQVSMNMVDYQRSQLFKAFELVKGFAERYGVPVVGSEIVGLVPLGAMVDAAEYYLRLENFNRKAILESRIMETSAVPRSLVSLTLNKFAEEVASEKPTPGGGSCSAYVATLAGALVSMVCRLTLKREEYAASHESAKKILERSQMRQANLLRLVQEDANSFDAVMSAFRLRKSTEEEQARRQEAVQSALKKAADTPMQTVEECARTLSDAVQLAQFGNKNALSDIETSVHLAYAAALGAASNVEINLASIKDSAYTKEMRVKLERTLSNCSNDKREALDMLKRRSQS